MNRLGKLKGHAFNGFALASVLLSLGCGRSPNRPPKPDFSTSNKKITGTFTYNCDASIKEINIHDNSTEVSPKSNVVVTVTFVYGSTTEGNTILDRSSSLEAVVSAEGHTAAIGFNSYGKNTTSQLTEFKFELGEPGVSHQIRGLVIKGKKYSGNIDCALDAAQSSPPVVSIEKSSLACSSEILVNGKRILGSNEPVMIKSVMGETQALVSEKNKKGLVNSVRAWGDASSTVAELWIKMPSDSDFYVISKVKGPNNPFSSSSQLGGKTVAFTCDSLNALPKNAPSPASTKRTKK